jgi:hypothetical protein
MIFFIPASLIVQGCAMCSKGMAVPRDLVSTGNARAIPRTVAYPKEKRASKTELCGAMEFRPLDQPLAEPKCEAVTTTYIVPSEHPEANEMAAMSSAMRKYPIGTTRRFFVRLQTLECLDHYDEENEFMRNRAIGIGLAAGLWPGFLIVTYLIVRGLQPTYSWGWCGRSAYRLARYLRESSARKIRRMEEEREKKRYQDQIEKTTLRDHLRLVPHQPTVRFMDVYVEQKNVDTMESPLFTNAV